MANEKCNNCEMAGREFCKGCSNNYPDLFSPKDTKEKKIIDLSRIPLNNIDMEFQRNGDDDFWWIGKLVKDCSSEGYESEEGYWPRCRVRKWHTHFYKPGCDLPEGLTINVIFSARILESVVVVTGSAEWKEILANENVSGFECFGPADGWCYSWDKNNE